MENSIIIFYTISGLAVAGIGFVAWLMVSEKKNDEIFAEMEQETQTERSQVLNQLGIEPNPLKNGKPPITPKSKPSKNLLSKLSFGKKKEETAEPIDPFTELKKNAKESTFGTQKESLYEENKTANATGTASLKTSGSESTARPIEEILTAKEQQNVEKELALSLEHQELKEKYEKLDALFKEKSSELDKSQKMLELEVKNRKEFNKVKDIYEKEIKDVKDKLKETQGEASNANAETDRHKKRISQLEENSAQLEKDILAKESQITELTKKLQNISPKVETPKPTPAANPLPVIEPTIKIALSSEPEQKLLEPTPEVKLLENTEHVKEPITPATDISTEIPERTLETKQENPEPLKLQPDILENPPSTDSEQPEPKPEQPTQSPE